MVVKVQKFNATNDARKRQQLADGVFDTRVPSATIVNVFELRKACIARYNQCMLWFHCCDGN